MSKSTTTECLLFPDLFGKPVSARFDLHNGSSDGGALLLKAADRRLGLIESLSDSLVDRRGLAWGAGAKVAGRSTPRHRERLLAEVETNESVVSVNVVLGLVR